MELPTLLLVLATYAGWLAVTFATATGRCGSSRRSPRFCITLHSSLQHEIVHGHPTRWRALNRLLGIVPLSLWLPYDRYRTLHRKHHIDERLTDPLDDPESYLLAPEDWRAQPA